MGTMATSSTILGIGYLDGPRLRRALLAGCRNVRRFQDELNRINVFPVPDGDAGTNLVLTAQAVAQGVGATNDRRADAVARAAAQSAVLGARGNCGMLVSHFLAGFADGMEGRGRATTAEFAAAMIEGAQTLERALDNPVEGTILTVVRDVARTAEDLATGDAEGEADFARLFPKLVEAGRESLKRTPELLFVLKRAGVVDAGAKGFVETLDGAMRLLSGEIRLEDVEEEDEDMWEGDDISDRLETLLGVKIGRKSSGGRGRGRASPIAALGREHMSGTRRYCTEILVEGSNLPPEEEVRSILREGSEDLLLIRTGNILKTHLHTDHPQKAIEYLRGLGTLVAHKAEDMFAQYEAAAAAGGGRTRRPTGVVVDSASDLPLAVRRAHGIHVVSILLILDNRTLRDGVDISAMTIHERIAAGKTLPTTSPPPPGEFAKALQTAVRDYESLVVVLMASAMSGVFRAAQAAASLVPGIELHLVDSRGASLLHGLLALKAVELAEDGVPPQDIVHELKRVRDQSGMLFTVRNLNRLRASGRVGHFQSWVGGLLNLKPVLRLDEQGAIEACAKVRGEAAARAAVFKHIESRIPRGATQVRFGVTHVGSPELAAELRDELRARYGNTEILVAPAAATVSLHTGTGAWGIAYMVED